jgi:transcriptional regulator GlxA family with amidase domain
MHRKLATMQQHVKICLFVSDQFSLFGYAIASELFRFANEELGEEKYVSNAVSLQPGLIRSSSGTEVNVTVGLEDKTPFDIIIVCSSVRNPSASTPQKLLSWLRLNHRLGKPICALGLAVWVVTESGILDGRKCAAHWAEIPAFRQTYPNVKFTKQSFTFEHQIWACSGGDTVTDMLLHLLGKRHGVEFATNLRRRLILKPGIVSGDPRNSMFHANSNDMELIGERFQALIETAIEKPLTMADICKQLQVPQRTLNRYCRTLFGQTPKAVYLEARLRYAKQLLTNTNLNIGDVAASCGFKAASHFSQVFRDRYDCSPSTFRS